MSRKTLRSLLAGLIFALMLLPMAARAEAAGLPDRTPGAALVVHVPQWLAGLWDKVAALIGANPAPRPGGVTQAPGADGDISTQIDPNG